MYFNDLFCLGFGSDNMSNIDSGSDLFLKTGSATLVQKGIIDSLWVYNTIQNGTKELD